MSTSNILRSRVSRETRQLLIAALVAVVALWLLARIRFPGAPATPNPIPSLLSQLSVAPRLVVDHLGMSQAGLPALLDLVKDGAYVKASGFGRIDVDPYSALRAIAALNPAAVVFGSDLPGTRARQPFSEADLDLVAEAAGERALYENGAALYR